MLEKEVLKDLTYHHEQSNILSSYYVHFFLQSTASHINCLIEHHIIATFFYIFTNEIKDINQIV